MIRVALVEPEIPPNTGNIARLCAATRVPLHIVGVTGFRLDDKAVRRAGLDYWPEVTLTAHSTLEDLHESLPDARFLISLPKPTRAMRIGRLAQRRLPGFWTRNARLARRRSARKLGPMPHDSYA